MKTKVFFDLFKGHRMFAVWEVDEEGNRIGDYPLFSLGAKKAVALHNHLEEFKDFAKMAEANNKNDIKKQ